MNERAVRLRRDIRFLRRIVDRSLDQGDEAVFEAAASLLKERRDDLDTLQLRRQLRRVREDAWGEAPF